MTSKARQTIYRLLPLCSLGFVACLWFAISAVKPDMVRHRWKSANALPNWR